MSEKKPTTKESLKTKNKLSLALKIKTFFKGYKAPKFLIFSSAGLLAVTLILSAFALWTAKQQTQTANASATNTGEIWATGLNTTGELGNGSLNNSSSLIQTIGTSYTAVSAGNNHGYGIKSDTTLWSWGYNAQGQLGNGTTTNSNTPIQVGSSGGWSKIAAGGYHGVGIKSNGTLWTWGYNGYGQLGQGDTTQRGSPSQVGSDTDWKEVSAGRDASYAIKTNGSLWAWGANYTGQLGDNSVVNKTAPTRVGTDTDWVKVEGSGYNDGTTYRGAAMALKSTGTLWAWGTNGYGNLGDGTTTQRNSPVQISAGSTWQEFGSGDVVSYGIKTDGTLWSWGYNGAGALGDGTTTQSNSPVQISPERDWKTVSANQNTTAIGIKTDGSAWSWGDNTLGQAGLGYFAAQSIYTPTRISNGNNWIQVSGGTNSFYLLSGTVATPTAVVPPAGQIWSSGYDGNGELGNGNTISRNSFGPTVGGSNWKEIYGGANRNGYGLKNDNTIWGWGANAAGQLGNGTTTDSNVPVQIGTSTGWSKVSAGYQFAIALRANGTLWAWGRNSEGQLGQGDNTQRLTPTQIGSDTDWAIIGTGSFVSYAIKTDGSLWSWGYNGWGALGVGDTANRSAPTRVGSDNDWAKITGGSYHTLALKTNGTLWAWGLNNYGQVGNSTNTNSSVPAQIGSSTWTEISGSKYWYDTTYGYVGFSLGIKSDGTLWAWGANNEGALGDGTYISRNSPKLVNNETDWKKIDTGTLFSYALKKDGTMWAWGRADDWEICAGVTTANNYTAPTRCGDGKNYVDMASTAYSVFGLTGTIPAPAGNSGSTGSYLWVTGLNDYSQLGNGNSTGLESFNIINSNSSWKMISGGAYHTVGIKSDNSLWAWGYNGVGSVGDGTTTDRTTAVPIGSSSDWKTVSAGRHHTLGIKNDGSLWVWGYNIYGQLGLGDTNDRSAPVKLGSDLDWKDAFTGGYTSYAIKNDGSLWSWGVNGYGQLGLGDVVQRNSPTRVGTENNWKKIEAGYQHTIGLKTNGTIWGWGYNAWGSIGDGTTADKISPVQIGSATNWSDISAGGGDYNSPWGTSFGIKTDGSLWGWGRNDYGNIGDGTIINKVVPTRVGAESDWKSVSGGNVNTMAIKTDGSLWGWGYSGDGRHGGGISWLQNNSPKRIGYSNNWTSVNADRASAFALTGTVGTPIDPVINTGEGSFGNCTPSGNVLIGNTYNCTFAINGTPPFALPANGLFVRTNQGANNSTSISSCTISVSTLTCNGIKTDNASFVAGSANIQFSVGSAATTWTTKGTITLQAPATVVDPSIPGIIGDSTNCVVSNAVTLGDVYTCDFPLTGTLPFALPTTGIFARTKQTAVGSTPVSCNIVISSTLRCNGIKTDNGIISGPGDVELGLTSSPTTWYKKGLVNIIPSSLVIPNTLNGVANCTLSGNVALGNNFDCSFALTGSANNYYSLPLGINIIASANTATGTSSNCTINNNGTANAILFCSSIPTTGATLGIQNILLQVGTNAAVVKGTVNIVNLVTDILYIDPNKIVFSPVESSAVKFGTQDLTLTVGGGSKDDPRFTSSGLTATCKFRLKEFGATDADATKGFDAVTLKLAAATTGGTYNSTTKTFDVPYTASAGCATKIPSAVQNQPKWLFEIRVVRSDSQVFGSANAYFQTYGAIGGVSISG
jgi:alpha-tubulin suppressor-like RCC1 family protein